MKKQFLAMAIMCGLAVGCQNHEQESSVSLLESPIITNDISNQRVTSFAEDAQGHIWIGTFRGLNRCNVHEFHQHFCTGDDFTIPDNQVQNIYRDSRGRLWVCTVNGISLYTEQDNFIRIPMDTRSRNVYQILEDNN